jgi:propane monooxygenase coupling protein
VSSPFKEEHTPSNRCGVTLMNVPFGLSIAEVMAEKPNVKVEYLPSMIRVDADHSMVFDYDEISEEYGEEVGPHHFEEVMSTHYGRMVIDDERGATLFFANPEDAAEYIGFDLQPVH